MQYNRAQREQCWKRATSIQAQEIWLQLSDRHRSEVQLLALRAGVTTVAFSLSADASGSSGATEAPSAVPLPAQNLAGPAEDFYGEHDPPPYESE